MRKHSGSFSHSFSHIENSGPPRVGNPYFSPNGATFTTTQDVEILCGTVGALIYYTTNGDVPDAESGSLYENPITISTTDTIIKAIAYKDGLVDSNVVTSAPFIKQVSAASFSPDGGSFSNLQSVTISGFSGASHYYTTNGDEPTTSSTLYEEPFDLNGTATLKVLSVKDGFTDSPVTTATFTFTVAALAFGTDGGAFNNDTTTTITTTTTGASIYYTLDGTTPDNTKTLYPGSAIDITGSATLRAIAIKSGYTSSAIKVSNPFTFTVGAITPEFTTATYNNDFTATFSIATTTGATKEYSYDNSSWSAYGSGQEIDQTRTYYMRATKSGYTSSTASAVYTMKCATPVLEDIGTSFNNATSMAVVSDTNNCELSYSGAASGTGTTENGESIDIIATGTITVIATKAGYADSDPATSPTITFTVGAITPDFTTNTYNNDFTATFSVATTIGATKEYSYDNSSWSAYGSGQTIDQTRTYYMRATKSGYTSATANATYTMAVGAITPATATGTYNADFTATASIGTTTGATAYYSFDNVTFNTLGAGVSIDRTRTVYYEGRKTGYTSSTASRTYTMQVATPTFSPVAGSYGSTQNVTVSTTTSGANGYYTTNGVDPTTGSTPISGTIAISATSTLKALMVRSNWTNSAIGSAAYTVSSLSDSDAASWVSRLSSAGYTMSSAKQTLTDTFFLALKSNNYFSKIKQMCCWQFNNVLYNNVSMIGSNVNFLNATHSGKTVVMNGSTSTCGALAISSGNGFTNGQCGFAVHHTSTKANGSTYHGVFAGGAGTSWAMCPSFSNNQSRYTVGSEGVDNTSGIYNPAPIGMYGMMQTSTTGLNAYYRNDAGTQTSLGVYTGLITAALPTTTWGWGARWRGDSASFDTHMGVSMDGAFMESGMSTAEFTGCMNLFRAYLLNMNAAA